MFSVEIIKKYQYFLVETRNLPNGYVATAGGVQEKRLHTQTKHCSAEHVCLC